MQSRHTRIQTAVLAVLATALVGAFAFIAVLYQRLETTRTDLARVEAGSALFAGQITGFQAQLVALEPRVTAGINESIEGLEDFAESALTFIVHIDEEIAIDTNIVIDRDIVVPISETVTIDEIIETTIEVNTPLGAIPVDVKVPVKVDVPINIDANIPINESIPIKTTVPVKMDVPIEINVADTELATLALSLAQGLEQLRTGLRDLTN